MTYHTFTILVNGEVVHAIHYPNFIGGYGEQYITSAQRWLIHNKYVDQPVQSHGGFEPLWSYCRDRGIAYVATATDVRRERDL